MSVIIEIQGTPIEFPSTGESPNWAPAVIQFAQSVEQALLAGGSPYDIAPQVYSIPADNYPTSDIEIPNLFFSSLLVRSAVVSYSLFFIGPSPLSTVTSETGTLTCFYNGSTWTLTRDYVGEAINGTVQFVISSSGQISIKQGLNLAGYTDSKISFSAKTLAQNS